VYIPPPSPLRPLPVLIDVVLLITEAFSRMITVPKLYIPAPRILAQSATPVVVPITELPDTEELLRIVNTPQL